MFSWENGGSCGHSPFFRSCCFQRGGTRIWKNRKAQQSAGQKPLFPCRRIRLPYSKKYLAEHEGDILLHKAAKNAFDELGVKKLPSVKSLQEEYAKLLAEKKAAYAEYRTARDEMRELLLHKQNVDRMLGKDERSEEKKQEHDRQ